MFSKIPTGYSGSLVQVTSRSLTSVSIAVCVPHFVITLLSITVTKRGRRRKTRVDGVAGSSRTELHSKNRCKHDRRGVKSKLTPRFSFTSPLNPFACDVARIQTRIPRVRVVVRRYPTGPECKHDGSISWLVFVDAFPSQSRVIFRRVRTRWLVASDIVVARATGNCVTRASLRQWVKSHLVDTVHVSTMEQRKQHRDVHTHPSFASWQTCAQISRNLSIHA